MNGESGGKAVLCAVCVALLTIWLVAIVLAGALEDPTPICGGGLVANISAGQEDGGGFGNGTATTWHPPPRT